MNHFPLTNTSKPDRINLKDDKMKVAIAGTDGDTIKKLKDLARRDGVKFTTPDKADIIVSAGGDGTFLTIERNWPGGPKILLRSRNKMCSDCSNYPIEKIVKALKKNKWQKKKFFKLECTARISGREHKFTAINEICIRNKDPRHALRFSIVANGKKLKNMVGDGVVIATPFGSSAYHFSISKKTFSTGIGIALNNISQPANAKSFVAPEKSRIKILIEREKATLCADNNPNIMTMEADDFVTIKKSRNSAVILKL